MISVIIPVLNEEEHIGPCIEALMQGGSGCEIIVVDGGSSDRTGEIAGNISGVNVVQSGKGRGFQMNSGAFGAKGDILLFLHAVTLFWRRAGTWQLRRLSETALLQAAHSPLQSTARAFNTDWLSSG